MSSGDIEVELREAELPLVRPFRTSRGVETSKRVLLLRWSPPGSTAATAGWAECGADPEPTYYPEYIATVRLALADVLVPMAREIAAGDGPLLPRLRAALADLPGMPLAKSALESAVLDAELRACGMPLRTYLGGDRERIPVGVSVGIPDSIDELLDWVSGYLDDGYRRIKLKVRPGWDVEPLRAVREAFGDALPLQVDANQAYRTSDIPHLLGLDAFGLLLLEQPFPADDLLGHARLAADLATPVCLDESITSVGATAAAISLGATDSVNIKPARVGGYPIARSIHDLCAAHGVPVFCGGMLETGIGRAMNLALACLPNFTLPGDISATSRYYERDITQHFELVDGHLVPPEGPGSGAIVDHDVLDDVTTAVTML
ncbi:o-succinylbenzoate synthase [Mobilicoccus massiliensis]|uniref:o-succinylbenzoate synthase n=1 Tax=Mobilicoccus massiliensis TaxID=1522310 RepID=UPI00058D020D|nr:o-succinylbenzoate synthase [Mobilicoccus massiliensis]